MNYTGRYTATITDMGPRPGERICLAVCDRGPMDSIGKIVI